MKRLRNDKGFTIAEVLVGSTLFLLLSGGLFMFVSAFDVMRYEFQTKLAMTNNARITLSRMIAGSQVGAVSNRQGMWEAVSFTIVAADDFRYTDTNGVTHEIRQNGLNIERSDNGGAWVTLHDPNGSAADDLTRYSTSLEFIQAPEPNVVQIQLNLGERNAGRWHNVSVTTNVAFRN